MKLNVNNIHIRNVEDLELLVTICKVLREYEKNPQEEIEITKKNIYGEPYTIVYPAARIAKNYQRIIAVRGLRGYVILDDNTIMCINSSPWVAQYDGCVEREMEIDFNNAIRGY